MHRRVVHRRNSPPREMSQPAGITRHMDWAFHDIGYQALCDRDSAGIGEPRVVETVGEGQQVGGLGPDLVTADDHGS
jgi:hypothetical protein